VESVGDDDDKARYLQSSKSSRSTESGHLNPETRARLRALLESTGIAIIIYYRKSYTEYNKGTRTSNECNKVHLVSVKCAVCSV